MSDNPFISVIVPCYNQSADSLRRTIDSVAEQTWRPLELIVVDDGSATPHAGVESQYPPDTTFPVHWLRLQDNAGVANARNQGLAVARGDYLAFLDSGDWWLPTKLERQMAIFKRSASPVGMVYCGVERHDRASGKTSVRLPTMAGNLSRPLLVRQVVTGSASAVIIRREVYESVGGFATLRDIPEDRDYWLRIAQAGWQADFAGEILIGIELDPQSRSSDPLKKSDTYAAFLRQHSNELTDQGLSSAAWLHYHLAIARKHLAQRQLFKAMIGLARGVVRYPGGIVKLARVSVPGMWRRLRTRGPSD